MGEGEWAAVQHGGRGHRDWKKLHLAVDRVGVIVAHALTEPTVDDATIGIDLIATGDDAIARVTADAAYEALTPLYVKTRVQAAWMSSWRARKSVMTRWEILRARKRFRHRMISRLVRPSAVRRATSSTVG